MNKTVTAYFDDQQTAQLAVSQAKNRCNQLIQAQYYSFERTTMALSLIHIFPIAARVSLMIRRAPQTPYYNEEFRDKMLRIQDCTHCEHCKNHCPYGLDTPELLKKNLQAFLQMYDEHLQTQAHE